jgi:hypothetical protein
MAIRGEAVVQWYDDMMASVRASPEYAELKNRIASECLDLAELERRFAPKQSYPWSNADER